MPRFVFALGGVAAVAVAAVLSINLLAGPQPGVGGQASPSPSPSPSPAPSPSQAEPSAAAGLPEGPYVLLDGQFDDGTQGIAMTVTIPAPGWDGGAGVLEKLPHGADGPDGAGIITFADGPGWYVPGDPCGWISTVPESRSTTVDELIAALAAQASRDASEPLDITVGGYAGKAITLHTPDDAAFVKCDRGSFCTLADPENPDPADAGDWCFRYGQGPGQIDNLWILDVDGQLVIIDWTHYAATPAEVVAEERAIVESATFETP